MVRTEQDFVILPGGVHVWGPEPEYLGAVPDDVIERGSAGHTLHILDTPGWRTLESKNVVVTGDVPDEALRVMAVTAEELNKMLVNEVGGPRPRSRYRIRVFDKREDFCRYAAICGGPNAISLYDPRVQEMALNLSPTTNQEEFEETFAHEFTHAYMDKIYRVTEPLWFAEGMAVYFSSLEWTDKGYRPTRKNPTAVIHLAEDIFPLRDLLKADRSDMYGVNFPAFYANAWAFTKFLLRKHPLVVEALLNRVKSDLSYLEPQYKAYVTRMLRG